MTTMTISAARQNWVFTAIRDWAKSVTAKWRAEADYRRTAAVLNALTDRELNDIGITRDQIASVAFRASFYQDT